MGRDVGTVVSCLVLPERFPTCVWSISLEPDTVCAPTDQGVNLPHPVRICWESPGIEKTHGKDLLEESCPLWVVREEIVSQRCAPRCSGSPGEGDLGWMLHPRSTQLLLPPALCICSFPFPWPRVGVTFLGYGIIFFFFEVKGTINLRAF